jgi:hypothetical protein
MLRDTNYRQQLRSFLMSSDCPVSLRLAYERDKHNATTKAEEPVDSSWKYGEEDFAQDADQDLTDAITCYSVVPSHMKPEQAYNFDYDFGYGFCWSSNHTSIELDDDNAESWLEDEIRKAENSCCLKIRLPANPHHENGTYEIEDLKGEQRNVAMEVISKLKEWCECQGDTTKMASFQPLRLTIRGKAGTGKTTLIHTLVTVIKRLFQTEDCVAVVCPSGCSAANAGGKTIHNRFRVPVHKQTLIPGATKRSALIADNKRLAMLILDERSMVSADVMGRMAAFIEQTAHNGRNLDNHDHGWGGIPVVLFLGDDGQLPPIGKGAFDFMEARTNLLLGTLKGLEIFRKMGETVRTLSVIQRQESDQNAYLGILEDAYRGQISIENTNHLMQFHLDNDRFTEEEREVIKERSIHIFANTEPMKQHNETCLFRDSSQVNPVARVRAIDNRTTTKGKSNHLSNTNLPASTIMARGAKICLNGRNLRPEWGLFNNCSGTIMDIVFHPDQSPNEKHLPKYILVEFPGYTGPAFVTEHPTYVPITPITIHCDHGCCSRTQIPLRLAYGQTIHTFQGITVGRSTETKKYETPSIIIDPGSLWFEGHSPGLFYSACSRGTTLGEENDKLSSSIYFQGKSMSPERVRDMIHGKNGRVFYRVHKRDIWTAYLDRNNRTVVIPEKEQENLLKWTKDTRLNSDYLDATVKAFNRFHNSNEN